MRSIFTQLISGSSLRSSGFVANSNSNSNSNGNSNGNSNSNSNSNRDPPASSPGRAAPSRPASGRRPAELGSGIDIDSYLYNVLFKENYVLSMCVDVYICCLVVYCVYSYL